VVLSVSTSGPRYSN